mgnify:CR=1 FL=1
MSDLRIETFVRPGADLGPENPLPPLGVGRDLHVVDNASSGIPEEMLRNIVYGRVPNVLPYTMQDGYNRVRTPRQFRVAILENEILRATFLLELGGRLWSLVHKPTGRELLDCNPVFQPANLALRNAWFSGGVEWNIGTTGHSPFTCSPLFAARLVSPEGVPVLRLYEWERIRQVPFQIDAYLPDGSPVLFVRVRIVNPHAETVPMYWWSNIAVPEMPSTRVIVPAASAYSFGYGGGGLARVAVPEIEGVDVSYPTNIGKAADFFFHIDVPGTRPWVTALDETGKGLVQVSTSLLQGRKLFVWGMGDGGRRWQTFLSEPGRAYIEIQAGLARTQLEHLPMPPGAEWTWLEAYGLMDADPSAVHGPDWQAAVADVGLRLEELIPRASLDAELARCTGWLDSPEGSQAVTLLQRGSGWGALERVRREASGEPPFATALAFDDDSLSAAQQPWVALLQSGTLPALSPLDSPTGYCVQPQWAGRLERFIVDEPDHESRWWALLHLGVLRYAAGDRMGAQEAWRLSMACTANAWAARNLAFAAWEEGRFEVALERYTQALEMQPALLPLAVEAGQKLIAMGHAQTWLDLLVGLPAAVRTAGRIRLLEGQAALETGDLERVEPLFDGSLVVDDLREGERSLSQLWIDYHISRLRRTEEGKALPASEALERVRRDYPVPAFLDFRMSSKA